MESTTLGRRLYWAMFMLGGESALVAGFPPKITEHRGLGEAEPLIGHESGYALSRSGLAPSPCGIIIAGYHPRLTCRAVMPAVMM